jgi:hypothetical protein
MAPAPKIRPIELFYSYSHKDDVLRERLEKHLSVLKRTGVLVDWHDRRIGAGTEWKGQINDCLERADMIVLLVSPDFLASDYCWDVEMKRAMNRHETGEAAVIPVMLHPVDCEGAPFAGLQALPRDGRPISSWASLDEAFMEVAKGIRAQARLLLEARTRMASEAEAFHVELWTASASDESTTAPAGQNRPAYRTGTRIAVLFRANRDCYLTLVNMGTSGRLTVLYPNSLHHDNRITANYLYRIPSPSDGFEYELTGPPGTERVKAIATLDDVALLETQFAQDGSLFRTVPAKAAARDIEVMHRRVETLPRTRATQAECSFSVVEALRV